MKYALPLLLLFPSLTFADTLAVTPSAVTLTGPRGEQRVLVVGEAAGRATADHSATAKFASANPKVATVDASGTIRAAGNGETTVTATAGGQTALAKVVVTGFDKPAERSFTRHVESVLTRTGCNSGACHGALAGKGGFKLSLRGYDPEADHFALTRQAGGRRVDGQEPDASLLLKKAARVLPHGGGRRFDADSDSYALLREWIAAGAPGPKSTDAAVAKLDIFPPLSLAKPGDKRALVVRATFTDGSTEDVTKWAKFVSSEEPVATVDENGVVNVIGHGESAVSALFGFKVVTATVTVPFANTVDADAFAKAPKANFIDDLVLKKLQLLNLPPSPQATDAEFIRRVYLDTCGVLPKPEEVAAFLADKSPDKRAKLIDQLLDRPEFVDYWAHKWSDLMLVSTRKLPQSAAWSFYRAVRESVADNKPWDRFARDILTASGSTLSTGETNYFVLHKDATDAMESTAVTFMGTSLACAKCHNHPLERWTQDQYWSAANLFSRVGRKSGTRKDEVVIASTPTGDAFHLRRGVPMPAAPLDGKPLPADSPTDRRAYFADWLTDAKNPFFAPAVVNRVWKNFLGRGLVEAEDDLRETNPPTNRELMDALVAEFVAKKFDTKHLMRLILNSATYQRSSRPLPANAGDDRFYSRYLLRRLPAEVILDAYSDLSGVPTPFNQIAIGVSGGTQNVAHYPPGTRAMQLPDSQLVSQFLDAFGRAERTVTCSCEVSKEGTVSQALHLNNGKSLNEKLRDKASVVAKWEKLTDAQVIDTLFAAAFARPATADERKKFLAALADAAKEGPSARREAIEDVIWAVLTGKEFLFNH